MGKNGLGSVVKHKDRLFSLRNHLLIDLCLLRLILSLSCRSDQKFGFEPIKVSQEKKVRCSYTSD